MLRVEGAEMSFVSLEGLGVSRGPHENMVGDTPYSKKVGSPTEASSLELHPGNRILWYP